MDSAAARMEPRGCLAIGLALVALIAVGCGGPQAAKPDPRGTLRFKGEPRDALVEVDEIHMGPINMFEKRGLLLRPGSHRVIVRAEGYFPKYRVVEIEQDSVVVMEVALRPVPE